VYAFASSEALALAPDVLPQQHGTELLKPRRRLVERPMIVRVTRRDIEMPAGAGLSCRCPKAVCLDADLAREYEVVGVDDSNRPMSLGEDAGSSPEAPLEFEITRAQVVLVPSREQTPTADTKATT
jgi:hypothetical protein